MKLPATCTIRHHAARAGRVAEKAFENGARRRHAWRRRRSTSKTILDRRWSDPLTKYMFCSPAEGGGRAGAGEREKARELGRRRCTSRRPRCAPGPPGSFEVFAPSSRPRARPFATVDRQPRRVRDGRHRAGGHRRRPAAGHRVRRGDHAHGRERFCPDGEQEAWLAEGRTRIGGRAAGQHGRRLSRVR